MEDKAPFIEFINTYYERTDHFPDDFITTENIQELAQLSEVPYAPIPVWNELLCALGFEGQIIPGTPERLWKLKVKG